MPLARRRGRFPGGARGLGLSAFLRPGVLSRRVPAAVSLAVAAIAGASPVFYLATLPHRVHQRCAGALRSASAFCSVSSATRVDRELAFVDALWQLYAAYLVMALGWTTMSIGAITNIVSLWFSSKRGLAISLALTGASCGAICIVPSLIAQIGAFGSPRPC